VHKRTLALLLLIIALPLAWAAAQPPPIAVQISGINPEAFPTVQVSADVFDSIGQPLRGLDASSFALVGDFASSATIINVENVTDDNLPFAAVLAIDVSTSMEGTPLARAKEAAIAFINSLRPDDPVAIITFGSTTQIVQPFTTDRAALTAAIEGLQVSGRTALYQGANDAVGLGAAAGVSRRAVILLSDGAEFGGLSSVGREAALESAIQTGVPVYTIGLGFGIDRSYLQELSEGTNAQYIESPSADQLTGIYQELAARFRSQYILTLETTVAGDGTTYPLTVQVNAPQGSAEASADFRAPIPVPIVRLMSAPAREVNTTESIAFEVLADDTLATVTLDSGAGAQPLVDFASPYTVSIDPLTLPPGERLYRISATDEDGDTGVIDIPVTIAALPPIIAFGNLEAGEVLMEDRTVTLSFISQTPVVHVAYLVDGADLAHRMGEPFDFVLDIEALGAGDHALRVVADNAGGGSTTAEIAFAVDAAAVAPTATPIPPSATSTATTLPTVVPPTPLPPTDIPASETPAPSSTPVPVAVVPTATPTPDLRATANAQASATQVVIVAQNATNTASALTVRQMTATAQAEVTQSAQLTITAEAQAVQAATADAAQAATLDTAREATQTAQALATTTAQVLIDQLATLDAQATQAAVATQGAAQAQTATAISQATATAAAAVRQTAAASATQQAELQQATAETRATRLAAAQATQTAGVQATFDTQATAVSLITAAPTLTPTLTPTPILVELTTEAPPGNFDLLPLLCVVGAIAGVLAVMFVLLGGRRRRGDRETRR
jgi:VWFA-related protein